MKGPVFQQFRKHSLSPPPPQKLKLLVILPGGGENRLVSVDRCGDVGLAKLTLSLASLVPGCAFSLCYRLPASAAVEAVACDDDVARMVAAHDRLAAEQGKCPLIRVYLFDVTPISRLEDLERGKVLGDLNERNRARKSANSCQILGGKAFGDQTSRRRIENFGPCSVCGLPSARCDRIECLRRKNSEKFYGEIATDRGNVLPWSVTRSITQPHKRPSHAQIGSPSYGLAGGSQSRGRKCENGNRCSSEKFDVPKPHPGARRRSGALKIVHAKAHQQHCLVNPTNDARHGAMVPEPGWPVVAFAQSDVQVDPSNQEQFSTARFAHHSYAAAKKLDNFNATYQDGAFANATQGLVQHTQNSQCAIKEDTMSSHKLDNRDATCQDGAFASAMEGLVHYTEKSNLAIKEDTNLHVPAHVSSARSPLSCSRASTSENAEKVGMDLEAITEKPVDVTKLDNTVADTTHCTDSKVNLSKNNANEMRTSRPLSTLLEQVSLEAENKLNHIKKDGDANNKPDVPNSLDLFSKEVGTATCRLPAVYSLLTSQELQTIENSDLEELRELGSGRYGTVFYGKWRGSDVAIKRLRSSCFDGGNLGEEKMVSDFWKEARLLGQLHHPNVVAFYGVVADGPVTNLAIVTEYMVNGSLKQVLKRKDRTIDRRKRLIIAMDAAFGMEYLHEKNIVHFDLKSHNFFVNMRDPHRPICKIGDLGLSKVRQHTLVSGGIRGTVPWMAPELFSSTTKMVTEKVDVYSFGIVMWELLTGEEPYENMRTKEILAGIIKGDLRPAVPSWCDPGWRSLMERCWSSDPDSRLPFSEIAKELRAIALSMHIK